MLIFWTHMKSVAVVMSAVYGVGTGVFWLVFFVLMESDPAIAIFFPILLTVLMVLMVVNYFVLEHREKLERGEVKPKDRK